MFFKNKPKFNESGQESAKTAQEWLPIKDIYNKSLLRKDGHLLSYIAIEPFNLSLKSDAEKKRIIGALHEAYNGLKESEQIFCLGRPVDLDAYLHALDEKYRQAPDTQRKWLLRNYLQYVGGIASSGEALEYRFFIILTQGPGKHAHEDLMKRTYELSGDISRAGLDVKVCDDREIVDLVFNFTHPVQSAYEDAPDYWGPVIPPQLG